MTARLIATITALLAILGAALATGEPAGEAEAFENVRLYTEVRSKSEMRAIMKEQAKALGVKCTHCHVKGQFALDDKPEKQVGRAMIEMVREINATFFPEAEQGVTCWTCHRGSTEPQLLRPLEDEASPEGAATPSADAGTD